MVSFRTCLVCALVLAPLSARASLLDIVFQSPQAPTPSQQVLLDNAEVFWETALGGYQPGIDIPNVMIDVGAFDADGEFGLLAVAGPTATVDAAGFVLPTRGFVDFDISDLARLETEGTLFGVLLHEVAHALGFGTLWEENGLYVAGSGAYTGAEGVSAYRQEFDSAATSVPVELDGTRGTIDAHWDETWAGGEGALMTGFIDTPLFLTETTLGSFRDLGYSGQATAAVVPLPAGLVLGLSGLAALGGLSRRRQQRPERPSV